MSEIRLKQEIYSLAHAGIGFVVVTLVLFGIGGTIYKVIAPDGWIAQLFGRSLSAGVATVGSLAVIFALAWFSRGWSSPSGRNRVSEVLVWGAAAAGLLYVAQLWTQGIL